MCSQLLDCNSVRYIHQSVAIMFFSRLCKYQQLVFQHRQIQRICNWSQPSLKSKILTPGKNFDSLSIENLPTLLLFTFGICKPLNNCQICWVYWKWKNNYSPRYFGASDFKIVIDNPRKCVPNFWIAIL